MLKNEKRLIITGLVGSSRYGPLLHEWWKSHYDIYAVKCQANILDHFGKDRVAMWAGTGISKESHKVRD